MKQLHPIKNLLRINKFQVANRILLIMTPKMPVHNDIDFKDQKQLLIPILHIIAVNAVINLLLLKSLAGSSCGRSGY